uniref:Uncharacterized protein n=1 Tax=Oryza barthii TaxID=65489 RepID=A0A0D3HC14_9ORYZ
MWRSKKPFGHHHCTLKEKSELAMSTWIADEDAALLLSESILLNPCGCTTGATGTGYMSVTSPANPSNAGALGGSSLCLCSRCTGDEQRLRVSDAPLLGVVSPLICARTSAPRRLHDWS